MSIQSLLTIFFSIGYLNQLAFESSWLHSKTHTEDITQQLLHVIQHEGGQAAANLALLDALMTYSWIIKSSKKQQTYHPLAPTISHSSASNWAT